MNVKAFALVLLGTVGVSTMGSLSFAQPAPPNAPRADGDKKSAPEFMPDMMERMGHMRQIMRMSPEDRAAFMDAHMAGIHAGLKLTADQEKLWPPVEAAARDAATKMMGLVEKYRTTERATDPIERLRRAAELAAVRADTLKKLADAAQPFYASLTADQKRRLPLLMHAHGGMRERVMERWDEWMHNRGRDGDERRGEDRRSRDK